jgi:hypothetical protein
MAGATLPKVPPRNPSKTSAILIGQDPRFRGRAPHFGTAPRHRGRMLRLPGLDAHREQRWRCGDGVATAPARSCERSMDEGRRVIYATLRRAELLPKCPTQSILLQPSRARRDCPIVSDRLAVRTSATALPDPSRVASTRSGPRFQSSTTSRQATGSHWLAETPSARGRC